MRKVTYPQEIEVWYVLPAIRKQLALALIGKGMAQKQVAQIMGVTEASISHYKKEKRASINILETPQIKEEITKSVETISQNNAVLTAEVLRLNKLVKDSGLLCTLYARNTTLQESERPCNSCDHHSKEQIQKSKETICYSTK